ncbi:MULTISPECIES: SPFH domain-containing protein [Bacillaceae]|uniref:SPFH domain-containing protein n=1 Tax=Evansella alkalicola TaxID=745819 RepID=A0ABS6JX99_9BACI|nr:MULTISPECIES: SPFH domain-containing protein [Bacillaceae]MBU9723201.1 SPFH domain-containing protein [Bacillus alkalicola]
MAVVEVIKYDGRDDVYAWKYPSSELGNWTQLIVNESQEAILFRGGQALDLFTAGRHTLSTENIPLLNKLVNLPFGGRSPFAAEVWYVNKKHSIDIKWGTSQPIQLQDPKYKIFVPVRSFGQFGIQIVDSRKFLIKLVGTMNTLDRKTLTEYFRGLLMTKIKDLISSYLVHKNISILDINAYISEISDHLTEKLKPQFEIYGIDVLNFYVNSINIPEEDEAVGRLKSALARRAEMDIVGYNYQQERSFDTLEHAAKNEGGNQAGMMGAGIGLGMGVGVGGAFGNSMAGITGNMQTSNEKACPKCQAANPENVRFCGSCGNDFHQQVQVENNKVVEEEGAVADVPQEATCVKCDSTIQKGFKFCSKCGDPYHPCENCGEDNEVDSTSCRRCGIKFPKACSQCGTSVHDGMKFCPECGNSMVLKCGSCQHVLEPGQKFCPECGSSQIGG